MAGIQGKPCVKYFTTEEDGDLMTQFRSHVGDSKATLKKMTLIAESDINVIINEGVSSDLYQTPDGIFTLSFGAGDVVIYSVVTDTADVEVWFGGVY